MFNHSPVKTSASYVEDQGSLGWVRTDPRSSSAFLRGNCDRRVQLYENFCMKEQNKNPHISLEEINEKYYLHVRNMELKTSSFSIFKFFEFVLIAFKKKFPQHALKFGYTSTVLKWINEHPTF